VAAFVKGALVMIAGWSQTSRGWEPTDGIAGDELDILPVPGESYVRASRELTNTERLYVDIYEKRPKAIAYYRNLQRRYEDGKRAEKVLAALQALHERAKAMEANFTVEGGCFGEPQVSGLLPGGHVTPNGRLLTPEAVSQLVAACYAAARI
jgi:hypothetical protein